MALNDIYRVSIEGELDGQLCVVTGHYAETLAGTETPDILSSSIAGSVQAQWRLSMLPLLSVSYEYHRTVVNQIQPVVGVHSFVVPDAPSFGQVVGDSLPGTVAVVVTKITLTPGRSGRGRSYIPGIPESISVGGRVQAGSIGDFGTALAASFPDITSVNGNVLEWVVYSKTPVPTWHRIISTRPNRVLGNQRRRRIGRGA